MKHIDAAGWACPRPVIEAKKALLSIQEGQVKVTVDNEAAKENLLRLTDSMHCTCETIHENSFYHIIITKNASNVCDPVSDHDTLVIAVTSDCFGSGSDELGASLMKAYLSALDEADKKPAALIFMNAGVKLAVTGSAALDTIKSLEAKGVEVLACGACLNYYGLTESLEAGSISNMYAIVEKMNASSNTIKI